MSGALLSTTMKTSIVDLRSNSLVAALLLAVGASASACRTDSATGRAATTSAERPDRRPAAGRTTDNTGFIDNGGRSSDMVSRSEASGMRATEAGSDRPTGTPGSGTPVPIEPSTRRSRGDSGEGAGAATSVRGLSGDNPTSGSPAAEAIGRLAQARCDRETACGRVGAGRAWGTQDLCVTRQRDHARAEIAGAACPRGVDSTQLASCLNALRAQACDDRRTELDAIAGCRLSALCAP